MKYLLITLLFTLLVSCTTAESENIVQPLTEKTQQTLDIPPARCSSDVMSRFSRMELLEKDGATCTLGLLIWKAYRGCTSETILCENEKWIMYEQGDGCEVALQIDVSGRSETIPMFYIDMDTEQIYASDDVRTFGVPNATVGCFTDLGINKLPDE